MWTMRAILMHATGDGARKYVPTALYSPPDSSSMPLPTKDTSVRTDAVQDVRTISTSRHELTPD